MVQSNEKGKFPFERGKFIVHSPGVSHFRGPLPTDHSPVDHGGAGGVRNDI